MVEGGAFSHKIDQVTIFLEILNLKGHLNPITGSRVTPILLNGWILPIGGASAVEGLQSTGLPLWADAFYKWIFPIGLSGEASWWRVCYQRGLPRLVSLPVVSLLGSLLNI